jgi:hypothetical protein
VGRPGHWSSSTYNATAASLDSREFWDIAVEAGVELLEYFECPSGISLREFIEVRLGEVGGRGVVM